MTVSVSIIHPMSITPASVTAGLTHTGDLFAPCGLARGGVSARTTRVGSLRAPSGGNPVSKFDLKRAEPFLCKVFNLKFLTLISYLILSYLMKNFNSRDSHGHHGSKRRELVQHGHSHGSHAFTHTVTSTQLQPRGAKRRLIDILILNSQSSTEVISGRSISQFYPLGIYMFVYFIA